MCIQSLKFAEFQDQVLSEVNTIKIEPKDNAKISDVENRRFELQDFVNLKSYIQMHVW